MIWAFLPCICSVSRSRVLSRRLAVTLNSPETQDSLSPRSIKRYLGLSGNQGRAMSWIRAGTALLAKRNGQLSSPPRSSLEKNKIKHNCSVKFTTEPSILRGMWALEKKEKRGGVKQKGEKKKKEKKDLISKNWASSSTLPESDNLPQHQPQGCKGCGGQGHSSSELLWGTFRQVHGLNVHAYTWAGQTNAGLSLETEETRTGAVSHLSRLPAGPFCYRHVMTDLPVPIIHPNL